MERNTIQIQHMKFRISNWQKFDLTGFCLPFLIGAPCVELKFVPSRTSGPCRASTINAFFSNHVGVTKLLDFKSSCMFKIEGRQSIKSIEIY